jgi:hypothetical protein
MQTNRCYQQFILLCVLFLSTLTTVSTSYAEESKQNTVIVEGRIVILNTDCSLQYESNDRFANTKDGNRVLLKEGGNWELVGNTPLTSKQQVRTSELDIKLNKVVIETYKKKVQKNSSVKTQTVFYVGITNSQYATKVINIKDGDISLIEVKDNSGKNYQVLSLKAVTEQLKPDSQSLLVVRAKKSPAIWDSVKSMSIVFKQGFFELESPVTLSQKVIDFEAQNVDGFE